MGRFAKEFMGIYKALGDDINAFCRAMNFNPTWQQQQLFDAVMAAMRGLAPPRIALRSGQGPGKTTATGIVGLWFAFRRHMALTIVTAGAMKTCREVWLGEARALMEKADPVLRQFFNITKSKIEVCGIPKWGVSTVTATKVENAQGFHAPHMIVIVEEASGVDREMLIQFLGTLSNQGALMILIGNPTSRESMFFDCFNSQAHLWQKLHWNAEDTARDYPHIVSPARNKIFEDMFTRDSDYYRIRVLGEFPLSDPDSVISAEHLEFCMESAMLMKAAAMPRDVKHGGGLAKQFGLDFARFGGDENVIFRRSGNALVEWRNFAHIEPSQLISTGFKWQKQAGWKDDDVWYVADAGGMGQGVMHLFYDAHKKVVEFHNQGKAIDQDYDNKVTEAYFHVARLVKERRCYIPKDSVLAAQLSNRKYYTTKKGKLILEPKDEYIKRGFDSPDRADAAVLALYDEVNVTGNISTGVTTGRHAGIRVGFR